MRLATCLTLCLLLPAAALAQEAPDAEPGIDYDTVRFDQVATAMRIDEPVTIDGLLTEPAWDVAPVSGNFTQHQPDTADRPGTRPKSASCTTTITSTSAPSILTRIPRRPQSTK